MNFVAGWGGLALSAWRDRSGLEAATEFVHPTLRKKREGWGTRAFEVVRSIARRFEIVCLETPSKLIFLRSVP